MEDDSDEPLALIVLAVGGGPGGGGGSGIPGSQPLFEGDRSLEEPALLTTAPAEAALLDAGGLDGVSNWSADGPTAFPLKDGDGKPCS